MVHGEDVARARESVRRIHRLIPGPAHLLARLGEPIDENYVAAFVETYEADWLALLLDEQRVVPAFAEVVSRVSGRAQWEPLELLLMEHWISTRPAAIKAALPPEFTFGKTLHHVRACLASHLFNLARSVGWRSPYTHVRALRAAEHYLASGVENIDYTAPERRASVLGKFGTSVVLQSHYQDIDSARLTLAIDALERAYELGNDGVEACALLALAYLRRGDAVGGRSDLIRAASFKGAESAALHIVQAQAWLRLVAFSATRQGREGFIARATSDLEAARRAGPRPLECAHIAVLSAICIAYGQGPEVLDIRGAKLPFGVRALARRWEGAATGAAENLLRLVISQLDGFDSIRREPIMRRVRAQCYSAIGDFLPPGSRYQLRAAWYRHAVEVRSGSQGGSKLTDSDSLLENVLDSFRLHEEYRQDWSLLSAVAAALDLATTDEGWATPILVLAQEFERRPEPWSQATLFELGNQVPKLRGSDLLAAVVRKDNGALYELAATRALRSREIGRRTLGGRSGAVMAEDFSGIVGETFVFKPTTVGLADHEGLRSEHIRTHIERVGLETSFELATVLAKADIPVGDGLRESNYDLVVAKRFHAGRILSDAAREAPATKREAQLDRASQFLAHIHCALAREASPERAMRRQLRQKELGRWLRNLKFRDPAALFEAWFQLIRELPRVARRDAHPANWIITPAQTIVAVDLEAQGVRPVGYEVAQLIDDLPLIEYGKAGWDVRNRVLRSYVRVLGHIDRRAARLGFEAGLVARAVRSLSDPGGSTESRAHGRDLLAMVAEFASTDACRRLAGRMLSEWEARASAENTGATDISTKRRQHLSRAMAFQLRHGAGNGRDASGWMPLDSLAALLNDDGLRTSVAELLAVANAIEERRYEVDAGRVRALYGHTRAVRAEFPRCESRAPLYHGTAYTNLDSILEADQGLLPGKRQFVHLSADIDIAVRTARRHGSAVVLRVDTENLPDLYAAGGNVFLTDSVPASALQIVPASELLLRDFG